MFLALTIIGGLIVGSFLNVCIVRLPEEESIVRPASHCRHCRTPVAWYDNIPVVSFVFLSGRCRACSSPIGLRYPLVELLTAGLFVALLMRGFPPRELLIYMALVSALVVITFIDIDHFIIPDAISLPSIIIAPGLAFVVGHVSVIDSLIGIVAGGGTLWLFAWLYEVIRKQEGMGFGDVKLLAMIGGLQGWPGAFFSVFCGALVGSLIGIGLLAAKRGRGDTAIPFGPFLALGSVVYLLAGDEIIAWYFGYRS